MDNGSDPGAIVAVLPRVVLERTSALCGAIGRSGPKVSIT